MLEVSEGLFGDVQVLREFLDSDIELSEFVIEDVSLWHPFVE